MAFSRLRYEAQKEREKKQEKQLGNQSNKGRVETPAPTQAPSNSRLRQAAQQEREKKAARQEQAAQEKRIEPRYPGVRVRGGETEPTRNATAELEELVASNAERRAELTAMLEEARQKEAEASRAQMLGTREVLNQNDLDKAFELAEAVKAASAEYNAIKRELEQLDYLEKYKDKTYDDTFIGQFGANKTLGRLGQDTSAAYNEYLNDPTEENKAYAEALDLLTEHFQMQNQTALDDENAKATWITKDLAQHLPQRWDQIKAGAAGAATVGLPLALVNPALGVTGAKWGATAGVGAQSYNQMRGAAFQTLLNAGIDEEIARQAAGDEAVLSAMAEMADTAWTLASLGVTSFAKAFGKGGTKAVAKEAAKGGSTMLAKALAKYGINIPQEILEEGFQQTVSIANLERTKRGETGFWNLVGETGDVAWDAITGENTEARDEIVDAGLAGGKLAIMLGGVQYATDAAVTTGVNSYVGKKYSDTESVQALIDSGLESAEGTESRKIAEKLQAKKQAGKTISNAEVGALQQANVAAMEAEVAVQQEQPAEVAESPQETLERLAKETVEEQQKTSQSEDMAGADGNQRTAIPYNAMSEDNPVRQSVMQAKQGLKKKTGYGAEGQKLFTEILDQGGIEEAELIARFDTPYHAGLTGLPMEKANLVNNFQVEAYNAGRMDNIAKMAEDNKHQPAAILSEKDSGFDFTGAPKDLTQEQKDFAVFFAKAMGVAGSWDGKNGKADYNALFNKSTGSVKFAQDFGISPKLMKKLGSTDYMQKVEQLAEKRGHSFIFYVAHEIADHAAADRAPKQMRAFNNAMYNYLQSHPTADSETIRKKQMFYASHKVDLDAHGATEEISADNILVLYDGDEQKFMDAMRRIFNSTDEQAKEGAKIYKNKLDEIIQKLKAWLRKLTGKENAEARANVEHGISELEQLRNMFEKAMGEAMQTVKDARAKGIDNTAKKADTDGNNIQMSAKNRPRAQRGRSIEMETMENNRFERLRQFGDDLPAQWFAFTKDYFYIYGNQSYMDYTVLAKVQITEKNRADIRAFEEEAKNGAFKPAETFDQWTSYFRRGKGRYSWDRVRSGNRGAAVQVDGVDERARGSEHIGDSAEDGGIGEVNYSLKVTDKKTLDFLNEQIERGEYDPVKNPNGGYIKVYRSFQVIDGKLYAPMNAVDRDADGKNHRLGYNSQYRVWEMATESPEIAQRYMDANPDAPYAKFDLDGVDNKTGGVAYNPYLHASNLVLNDQFSAAYRRNLITVECYVPVSEANGAYKAKYAKDATGWVEWKPGGVAGKLMKQKPEYTRKLFVSRYMLPVREVKAPELASMYKEYLDGTNIKVPWNVVTPELRRELVKAGVGIDYKDVYQSTDKKTGEKKYAKFDEVFPGERQYSLKDSEGRELSKEQQEYFKDSKVRDDQGRLITVYHSSPTAGFTVFNGEQGNGDYRFSEYGTGITFFTDNKEMAASYGDGEGSQYEGYLNITEPYVVDAKGRAWDRVSSEFSQQLYEQTRDAFTAEEKDALIDLAGWEDFAAFNEEVSRAVRDSGKPTADKHTKLLNSAFWKCSDMFALFSMAAENFSDDVIRRNSYMDLTTNQIVEKALQAGSYDGVIIKNVIDYGFEGFHTSMTPTGTDYIIFNSNQFKSKDNKSPTEDPDIRYSIKSTAHAAGLEVGHDEKGKVVFKMDGKVVTSVTADHIKNDSGLGALITVAADKGNITRADAKKQYTAMAEIMNMIMRTQDPDLVWAWVGSSMFSALKSNADGQYGTTIDFTTVCRKTQDIITAMSRAMMQMKRGLTKDEVTRLQAELIGVGSSVPCPVRYVFSRWAGIGSILDNMYRWQEKYDGYTDEQLSKRVDELTEKLGKGKAKDLKKMLREQDEEYDSLDHESEMLSLEKKQLTAKRKKAVRDNDAYTLRSVDDRLSQVEKRISQVKKRMNEIKASVAPELAWLLQVRTAPAYAKHGKVKANVLFNLDDAATFAESYPLAWKYRTSRGPSAGKAILPYSDMRLGDMILGVDSNSASGNDLFANVTGQFNEQQMAALDKAIKRTKAQNLIGGQRFQSTSDFRYDYALDYLMAFFEAQALGSKMQTYTKIIEFADMVAAVGGDVNLSVMPKNKGFITTADGVNRLVFSSVTGIDFEAAKRANELHDSAQLILVGINDEHILAALEDSEETQGKHIGFVIPYHASGASINEFIRVLVSNLGESFTLKYYQDYSDVQSDKERANATAAQKRRNDLRSKLLKGKDGGKNWEPTAEDLAFIRGKSVDISGKSFADLRSIERKALSGNKAAIAEYESWTAGALWDLYNKMWVKGGAEYGVRLNTNQAKAVMPHEYWNKNVTRDKAYINGFLFRSYCYNLGLTPRFTGATVKGEKHGDFTDSKGYWKTLIDRPMYNNDGTYRDQQVVNMTNFQKDMLTKEYAKKHWDGYSVQEPDVVRAGRAADRFIEKTQNGQYSLKGEQAMRDELARIRREGAKAGKSQADIEAEVAGVVGPEYAKLLKTYGEIDSGEKPYREIKVPRLTEEDRKVSQTIRTVLEAKVTPDAAVPTIQEMITQGDFSYDVYSDKEARVAAEATIRHKGYETALADWLADVKAGKVSKKSTALGWALYNAAATSGDLKTAMSVLNGMVQHQRNAAQALQATRILKKLEPDAQLYGIQRSVESLQEEITKKYGKKAPELKVDEDLAKKFLNAKTEEERAEAEADIYRDIGKQMPSNFWDKWNAWRYLAMLGNPRTHVRNVFGNLGFAPVVLTKDLTATIIESAVSFVSGGKIDRTKGMPGAKLLQAAWADYANVADQVTAGGKYSDSAMKNQYVQEGRTIFKFKPLEKARKGNTAAMETEDMWFARPHYAFALAQYCKAHGVTVDQLKNGKALGNGRDYAIREAQKATYRDTNAFSQTISELGKYHGDNKVKKGVSLVTEGILPFRKTPANILVRGLEYSPIGLANGIKQAVWDVQRGNKTAAEAIDNIAAGLTGTGLLGLGIYLAAEGLIRGAGGGDDEEKKFEELMGHQTYALELPNGKSITLDWLAPEVLPLFIGVNLYEMASENKGQSNLADILSAISNVTEPLLEMSCLQSLNDLFDSFGYSNDGLSPLPKALISAATSYLTQAFPTILGQAERSAQDKRMTTYTEKNAFLTPDAQYLLGKVSAKLPGWDFNQIPYVDAWGRTESTGSTASNIANNFLNPAYMSQIETSEMEEELQRLYDATGEGSVLPSRADKKFTVNKEDKYLTSEEYVEYATEKGQMSYDMMTELTSGREYAKMDDSDKAKAVGLVYEYANAVAKTTMSDYEPTGWVAKALEAEQTTGMDEMEYILYKMALEMADGTNETEQKANAISSMSSLSDDEIAFLWGTESASKAYNAGIDMRTYVDLLGDGKSVDVDKLVEAKNAGISIDTYIDYRDTLKSVDQPTESGKYGSFTNKEKAEAISALKLKDKEIAYFWDTDEGYAALDAGVRMDKFVEFKAAMSDIKADKNANGKTISGSKKKKVIALLNSMSLTSAEWNWLYGTEYKK